MQQFFDTLQDLSGNALPNGSVVVTAYPGGGPVQLYSDNGLTPTSSTVLADATGQVSFFAADGDYIVVYKNSGTTYKTRSPVSILDSVHGLTFQDTGAANAYAVTDGRLEKVLRTGLRINVQIANASTGASTFLYNSTSAKPVINQDGSAVTSSTFAAGGIYLLEYNGTSWIARQGPNPYPILGTETGVTQTQFPYGDIRRFGGVCDSGTTDNKTPLQNCINSNAGLTNVTIPSVSGQYYKVSDRVTCPAHTVIVGVGGLPELRWSACSSAGATFNGASSTPALESQGDDFSITGVKVTGPTAANTFKAGEIGILRVGPSAAARGSRFKIEGCEISGFGQYAIGTQYLQNIYVRWNKVHDCGYSGGTHLSPLNALHEFNEIYNIQPGTGNAYGDNFSHISTNYNSDPLVGAPITSITNAAAAVVTISTVSATNPYVAGMDAEFFSATGMTQINGLKGTVSSPGGVSGAWTFTVNINTSGFGVYSGSGMVSCPRQATNPFAIGCISRNNYIHDIPSWGAIDFHGGYECVAEKNVIANCYIGVQLSGSSGPGANYAGENNAIIDNSIFYDQLNGNASQVNAIRGSGVAFAVIANGGSVTPHRNIRVSGNKAYGTFGDPTGFGGTAFVIQAQYCRKLVCTDNMMIGFNGCGIYVAQSDGVINNNTFGWVTTPANSICIYAQGNSDITVKGNRHTPEGLNAAAVGFNCLITGMTAMHLDNDFTECTLAYGTGVNALTRCMSDVVPVIADATTGSHTVNAAVVGSAPRFVISATQAAIATLTSILNPFCVGQECLIMMTGASTLTVNDTGNIRLNGGTQALTSSSVLALVWDGAHWQQFGLAIGNT